MCTRQPRKQPAIGLELSLSPIATTILSAISLTNELLTAPTKRPLPFHL